MDQALHARDILYRLPDRSLVAAGIAAKEMESGAVSERTMLDERPDNGLGSGPSLAGGAGLWFGKRGKAGYAGTPRFWFAEYESVPHTGLYLLLLSNEID
jgi:hypothetical protein